MRVIWKQFQALTADELYAILHLRAKVFVVEQHCPYQDCDYKDQIAMHGMGFEGEKLVAYCRFFKKGDYMEDSVSFGRVVTHPDFRGRNLGRLIVQSAMDYAAENHPKETIHISAQSYLKQFYEAFGLQAEGDEYLEDNIPHIAMKCIVNTQ